MFTTRPEIIGHFGVVATTHWLASQSGMAMLERGGNAFDAAVAAAFVLQVVEPHMNGPAGDVPILMRASAEGRVRVICGQGPAPAAASIAHYRGEGLDMVPGTGLLASVIPGAFDAWMLLLRDHGRLPLDEVLAPAIGYARAGWPMIPAVSDTIAGIADMFRREWTSSATVWLADGAPGPGDRMRNPALADTWERILAEADAAGGTGAADNREARIDAARRAWSEGFVAEAVDRFCAGEPVADTAGRRSRGVLTAADMAGWQATYEDPATLDYEAGGHVYTVCKPGPWCQGPVFLQHLALLRGFDVAAMDPSGAEFVHTVTECMKLGFADREAWYGDPDFVEVPLETLLSEEYNAARRGLIGAQANNRFLPGEIAGRQIRLAEIEVGEPLAAGAGMGLGEPLAAGGGGDTCHIDVIDGDGNMVSAMPSGGWLQSSPVVPELGFPLNTRAQMFRLEEGLAASLEPGKRPRTTLSPSLALRDGEGWMAFGTPGGDGQDQWPLAFFLRHIHHGMNLQEAIDAPAFYSQHMPNSFWPRRALPGRLTLEARFDEAVRVELSRRGHDVEVTPDWSLGRISAATRDGPFLRAAANPRGMQGYAVGR